MSACPMAAHSTGYADTKADVDADVDAAADDHNGADAEEVAVTDVDVDANADAEVDPKFANYGDGCCHRWS